MCRSVDIVLAGGLALGAEDLKSLADGLIGADAGFVASAVEGAAGVPGSLILLLENILSSSYINHWVNGSSAYADFVVKVRAG